MEQTEKQTIITQSEAETIARICGWSRSSVVQLVRGIWNPKGERLKEKKKKILIHLDEIRNIKHRHDADCNEEIAEYIEKHRWKQDGKQVTANQNV